MTFHRSGARNILVMGGGSTVVRGTTPAGVATFMDVPASMRVFRTVMCGTASIASEREGDAVPASPPGSCADQIAVAPLPKGGETRFTDWGRYRP